MTEEEKKPDDARWAEKWKRTAESARQHKEEARWAATWKRLGESQRRMFERSAPLFATQWSGDDDED